MHTCTLHINICVWVGVRMHVHVRVCASVSARKRKYPHNPARSPRDRNVWPRKEAIGGGASRPLAMRR